MIVIWAIEVALKMGHSGWTMAVAMEVDESGLSYAGSSSCDKK